MKEIPKSPERLAILEKIAQYEREGRFDEDVENDPPSRVLLPEEIAYARGYISRQTLLRHAEELNKTLYGRYLECL